jgi:hypothetical protein
MKCAALGIRMHSGWGVLVAVSRDATSLEVLDRRRIVTIDPQIIGSSQPYHHAANLGLPESERYLANCAAISERLAFTAIGELLKELDAGGCRIAGAAVPLASGRPLPPLGKILAAHPLIHAAEGEFFRNAASKACELLKIPVTAVRERELEQQAKTIFGKAASGVRRRISTLGGSLGPHWTKDHKTAALAAVMILV